MNAAALIDKLEFFNANCIAVGNTAPLGYRIKNHRLEIDERVTIDSSQITGLAELFSVKIGDALYGGGEAFAHGSCGFFYKKIDDRLTWALMSRDSNPFIRAEPCAIGIRFISSAGTAWIVQEDDIRTVVIESLSPWPNDGARI